MQSFFTLVITTLCFYNVFSQINPDKIDIVRDEFGVPHIFAKTDAEVALMKEAALLVSALWVLHLMP